MNVSIGRYALGVAALAIVCGSLALASVSVRRRFFEDWDGALARLAECVIGLAFLVAILELLGAIGLFRLGPVVAACALAGAATLLALGAGGPTALGTGDPTGPRAGGRRDFWPEHRAAAAVAVVAAAALLAEWAGGTLQSYDVGIRGFDSLWYHLPWAASFAQTGHVTPLRFTDVEYLTPFYPATSELLHGLGIVLLGRDTLSPGLNMLWLALVLLAAYCVGRPRGAGSATLLGAAVAMATMMVDFSQAGSAANDVVGIFFLLAAVALIAGEAARPRARVLAAVAAGLAASVKLTFLAPVLALTVGVAATAPRGRRAAAAGQWVGPLVLAGGFWYARNLVSVGNPLPWTSFGILPTPAAPLQQHTAFSVAHYLTDSHALVHFFGPGLASGLGPWWYVVAAAAVLGPVLCLFGRVDRMLPMLALVALASVAAYLLTPESAAGPAGDPAGFAFNLRYAAPALTLSLAVLPLAPVLAEPLRYGATALVLGALFIATIARPALWPTQHLLGAFVVGAAVGIPGLAWVVAAQRPRFGHRRSRPLQARPLLGRPPRARPARAWLLTVAAVLIGAGAAAGYIGQRHYLRGRYVYHPGVSHLSPVWAWFRSVHHARVGVAGTFGGFFSYPLFGLDASNRVQYVARRGAHGSFTPIDRCAAWRAAVNVERFDYIVTTPARDPWHPSVLGPSPEGRWTASDPRARVVLRVPAQAQLITVFRLSGPLNPAACG